MFILDFAYLIIILTIVFLSLGAVTKMLYLNKQKDLLVPLLVIIPQGLSSPLKEHRPNEIQLSTQLYSQLHEKRIPFVLEVTVQGVAEEIHFYLSVARKHIQTVSNIIETIWPTGYVTSDNDYHLWVDSLHQEKGSIVAGYLKELKPYSIPLKTAKKGVFEPFTPILAHLSHLNILGESVVIQWSAVPAPVQIYQNVSRLITRLRLGNYYPSKYIHKEFVITPKSIQDIQDKIEKPLFKVNCRIVASAKTKIKAQAIINRLEGILTGTTNPDKYNEFSLVKPANQDSLINSFLTREFQESQSMILNTQELATYFHLPGTKTPLPKLKSD